MSDTTTIVLTAYFAFWLFAGLIWLVCKVAASKPRRRVYISPKMREIVQESGREFSEALREAGRTGEARFTHRGETIIVRCQFAPKTQV